MLDALEGTRNSCLLGEPFRRPPDLPGSAPLRCPAVSRPDPTRLWYVRVLDSTSMCITYDGMFDLQVHEIVLLFPWCCHEIYMHQYTLALWHEWALVRRRGDLHVFRPLGLGLPELPNTSIDYSCLRIVCFIMQIVQHIRITQVIQHIWITHKSFNIIFVGGIIILSEYIAFGLAKAHAT